MIKRKAITISLTPKLEQVVERELRRKNFASKSEFFRHLLRLWQEGRLGRMF